MMKTTVGEMIDYCLIKDQGHPMAKVENGYAECGWDFDFNSWKLSVYRSVREVNHDVGCGTFYEGVNLIEIIRFKRIRVEGDDKKK